LEVHLRLYSILREKLPPEAKGRGVLQMDQGATLADILEELGIKRRVVMSVNGEHEPDQSRQLRDGDQVKITSAISGGVGALPLDQSRGKGE
jgi:sulfur carrier protein ThiS